MDSKVSLIYKYYILLLHLRGSDDIENEAGYCACVDTGGHNNPNIPQLDNSDPKGQRIYHRLNQGSQNSKE